MKLSPEQIQRARFLFNRNKSLGKEEHDVQLELAKLVGVELAGDQPSYLYVQEMVFEDFLRICDIES